MGTFAAQNQHPMSQQIKIKNALISVYYKDGLEPLVRLLASQGVQLFSTGGTEQFIKDLNLPVTAVEDLTGYPSILGGRVKTLHPKVFGGILNRRNLDADKAQINEFEIPEIDLVIVDLYPFEETLKSGGTAEEIIEKIDIGGISLIRAAAKNFNDVVILASKDDYSTLQEQLENQNGETTLTCKTFLFAVIAVEKFAKRLSQEMKTISYFLRIILK